MRAHLDLSHADLSRTDIVRTGIARADNTRTRTAPTARRPRRPGAAVLLLSLVVPVCVAVVPFGAAGAQSRTVARAESLITAPYTLEQRLDADLDGDGDKDAILVGAEGIVSKDETAEGSDGNRVLVVARNDGKTFTQIGLGKNALQCRRCGGAFWGVVVPPVSMRVEKKVLIIDQEAGSREVVVWTHRYRIEGKSVRLIGVDRALRDRATGGSAIESDNLLTGARVVTIDGEVDSALRPGRTKGKPKRVLLEAVTLE
jgi:hypothetical protein